MRFDLFATPVWQFPPNPRLSLSAITELVHLEQEEDPKGNEISNVGGWQSQMYLNKKEAWAPLAQHILQSSAKALEEWGLGLAGKLPYMNTMWANVNRGQDINFAHDHWAFPVPHFNLLSGAYYVKCDENSGAIKFIDERTASKYVFLAPFIVKPNHLSADMFRIQPKEGTLVMFPSWVKHSVEASKSDEERISISFNLSVPKELMQRLLDSRG